MDAEVAGSTPVKHPTTFLPYSVIKVQAMKLHNYNSFGVIYLTSTHVKVNISAVTMSGKAIQRSYLKEFDQPIPLDEPIVISFASMIESTGESKTAFNDITSKGESPAAATHPEVGKALAQAILQVRLAVYP